MHVNSNSIRLLGRFRRTLALLLICLAGAAAAARADAPIFYYYHSDHLGSTSVVTNAQGAQVDHYQYTAYGRTRSAAPAGVPLTNRFTSQAFDEGTGLYYYNARYYDPELGNFISPDTIIPELGDPQSLNRYSYVRNNPLNKTDPSGNYDEEGNAESVGEVFVLLGTGVIDAAKMLSPQSLFGGVHVTKQSFISMYPKIDQDFHEMRLDNPRTLGRVAALGALGAFGERAGIASEKSTMSYRPGAVMTEIGAEVSEAETHGGEVMARNGYDVTFKQTMNNKGIAGQRTADVSLTGHSEYGPVDIYTPNPNTSATNMARRIASKSDQAENVFVNGYANGKSYNLSPELMKEVEDRVFGKPEASGINRLIYENKDGGLNVLLRPRTYYVPN